MLSDYYSSLRQMDGLHIRVDRAAAPKSQGGDGALYDPARSLFVGNLHFQTKVRLAYSVSLEMRSRSHYDIHDLTSTLQPQDEEVIKLFSDTSVAPELQGAVEAVRVVRDPATNIGKGFAFVLFKTKVWCAEIRVIGVIFPMEISDPLRLFAIHSGGSEGGPATRRLVDPPEAPPSREKGGSSQGGPQEGHQRSRSGKICKQKIFVSSRSFKGFQRCLGGGITLDCPGRLAYPRVNQKVNPGLVEGNPG